MAYISPETSSHRAIYKCEFCKKEFVGFHYNNSLKDYTFNLVYYMSRGTFIHVVDIGEVGIKMPHKCENGNIGIANFVGIDTSNESMSGAGNE